MSIPESHEITLNRAKEEPVPASFPGGFILLPEQLAECEHQNRPASVPQMTLICHWPLNLLCVSGREGDLNQRLAQSACSR
jgi:hypothetical protein